MSCVCVCLFAMLPMGLPYEAPVDQIDAVDVPDMELLEFLGGLEDGDSEWQEFFRGISAQIESEDDDAN